MRSWLAFVTRNRFLEVTLAVALGIAAYEAAKRLPELAIYALAQHIGRAPDGEDLGGTNLFYAPYSLYIEVANTYVVYGEVLVAVLTLGLVGLGVWAVVRRRDRELGECPFCASRIPYESTHCAYCGSGVTPGEP